MNGEWTRWMAIVPAALLCAAGAPRTAAAGAEVRHVRAADGAVVDVIPKTEVVDGRVVSVSWEETAGESASRTGAGEEGVVFAPAAFSWQLQSSSTAVFTDLSMGDATHGFASAELGRVFRTTDGSTWTQVLNDGFPYYWYGVHAFSPDTVIVTGFNNSSGEGVARWSYDGGTTWGTIFAIDPSNWLTIVQFADRDHGVATNIGGGTTWVTTNGGASGSDWALVTADPSGGWFAGNFTFQPASLRVYLCGISFCQSSNGGLSYSAVPSVDPVFDGGVSFPDSLHGWTGGGQISSPVQGWVHHTTDGATSWSGRILNPPWPIRALLFFDDLTGFAVGGNYFQSVGGIWSTTDGGANWNLDVDSGCEMKGIDWARVSSESVDVWCAGSRSGLGRIYHTRLYLPASATSVAEVASPRVFLTARPNPSRGETRFALIDAGRQPGAAHGQQLVLWDARGRVVRRLEMAPAASGVGGASASASWDGRDASGERVPSGVYFYRLAGVEGAGAVRKLILAR